MIESNENVVAYALWFLALIAGGLWYRRMSESAARREWASYHRWLKGHSSRRGREE